MTLPCCNDTRAASLIISGTAPRLNSRRQSWRWSRSISSRLAALEARVNDLEARLKLNSTNSSKPPSSDPIGLKRKPPAPPSGKKRGGQAGHRKAHRPLVPPEKVRETFDCKPTSCRRCGAGTSRRRSHPVDPSGRRTAQDRADRRRIPAPSPGLSRLWRDRPARPCPPVSPRRLRAVSAGRLAVFAGAYRLSKRQIQQLSADLFGLSISTGMISKLERRSAAVLEAPYNELAVSVHSSDAANIDETSWRQDRKKAWLWVTVTPDRYGLHHRPPPLGRGGQGLVGERAGSGRRQRSVQRL